MPPPASARQPESHDGGWFATPLAQKLLRREQHEAIPRLTSIYGHTGLYLRCMVDAPAELSGNMLHRLLRLHRADARLEGDLCCVEHDLPLLRESVDLVYLLHAFEQSPQRQYLLLELERVLGPEGNLFIVGLNPWSPWRWRWSGSGLRVTSAARQRSLLDEAGFEVVARQALGPLLPWLDQPGMTHVVRHRRDPFANWRAGYLIHARKRRRGVTPLRSRTVALQAGMRPG